MSSNQSSGCFSAVAQFVLVVVFIGFPYAYALAVLVEEDGFHWWSPFVAVPIGVLCAVGLFNLSWDLPRLLLVAGAPGMMGLLAVPLLVRHGLVDWIAVPIAVNLLWALLSGIKAKIGSSQLWTINCVSSVVSAVLLTAIVASESAG